jgi:hypothetical protein
MWATAACQALRNGKRLQLSYDGFTRVVEVHTVGTTTADNECMSVWQVRGGSDSNEPIGWKLMRVDEALAAVEINEKSEAPRTGYKRYAKPFRAIRCQI